MIKIISEGKIKHRHECNNCNCVFEYDAEDVTKEIVYDDHGGHYPCACWYVVKCPFCDKELHLSESNFTDSEVKQMKTTKK